MEHVIHTADIKKTPCQSKMLHSVFWL